MDRGCQKKSVNLMDLLFLPEISYSIVLTKRVSYSQLILRACIKIFKAVNYFIYKMFPVTDVLLTGVAYGEW